jgi:hypothetical protein
MQTLSRGWKGLLAGIAVLASAVSADARAEYQYLYSGNVFTLVSDQLVELSPGFFYHQISTDDAYISATITTPELLKSGSGLDEVTKFSLTLTQINNGFSSQRILYFPYPFSGPFDPPGTSGNPNIVPVLSIGAVNGAGLPVAWDISIASDYAVLTGRHFTDFFRTSTGLDAAAGGYEGFSNYGGMLVSNPGSWRVSVVPEIQTYGLLLAGLALLGVASHRNRKAAADRVFDSATGA